LFNKTNIILGDVLEIIIVSLNKVISVRCCSRNKRDVLLNRTILLQY